MAGLVFVSELHTMVPSFCTTLENRALPLHAARSSMTQQLLFIISQTSESVWKDTLLAGPVLKGQPSRQSATVKAMPVFGKSKARVQAIYASKSAEAQLREGRSFLSSKAAPREVQPGVRLSTQLL